MVYFLGDWGMGDTKCATIDSGKQTTPTQSFRAEFFFSNKQNAHRLSFLSHSTGANNQLLPSAIDQATSIEINRTLSNVAVEAIDATSSSLLSSASSSSSSLTSLALNATATTEANNGLYNTNETNSLLQPTNDQLHQQTLSLSRATELIRQRSSSIHLIQHEDRHKLTQQQQQEHDDEVALHPLTNQVFKFIILQK